MKTSKKRRKRDTNYKPTGEGKEEHRRSRRSNEEHTEEASSKQALKKTVKAHFKQRYTR